MYYLTEDNMWKISVILFLKLGQRLRRFGVKVCFILSSSLIFSQRSGTIDAILVEGIMGNFLLKQF